MRDETTPELPIVRRGYDRVKVDAYVAATAAELDRLAAENRSLHRELNDARSRGGPAGPTAATEIEVARDYLDRMVRAARTARDQARAQTDAARAELDELTRATRTQRDGAHAEIERTQRELDRLADVARRQRDGAHAEIEAARQELAALRAERTRTLGELAAARAELDRLVRTRVEVRRELGQLGEALRRWLGSSVATGDVDFAASETRSVLAARTPPAPPAPPVDPTR